MRNPEFDNISEAIRFMNSIGTEGAIYGGPFIGGKKLLQNPEELALCLVWCNHAIPEIENILEIGVAHGASSYVLNKVFSPTRHIAIDIENVLVREGTAKNLEGVELWVGNSNSEEARTHLKETGLLFDLVLLDGDHKYEAVRNDLELVLPHCHNGSRIIFHDTNQGLEGPKQLMKEINENYFPNVRVELLATMGRLGTTVVEVRK